MRQLSLAILTALALAVAVKAAAPQNDAFAKAAVLDGAYHELLGIDPSQATAQPLDPPLAGAVPAHTLWFRLGPVEQSGGTLEVILQESGALRAGFFTVLDPDNQARVVQAVQHAAEAAARPTDVS